MRGDPSCYNGPRNLCDVIVLSSVIEKNTGRLNGHGRVALSPLVGILQPDDTRLGASAILLTGTMLPCVSSE